MEQVKNVLSLDLARVTGFAISIGGELYKSGTHIFTKKGFAKINELQRFVVQTIDILDINHIVVEYPITRSTTIKMDKKILLIGMCAAVLCLCDEREILYTGINPKTLKKRFCGNGSAEKIEMIKKARALGFDPKDDNESDALALLSVEGYI